MRSSEILTGVQALVPEMVAIRKQIHSQPELGFEEQLTSDLVASFLTEWGYTVHRGLGGTGVVGQLIKGEGRKLGLRADMDALPIQEATDVPYQSLHPGKMHACGHDGHTASLLTAAKFLAKTGQFNGTLNVIFQPAEEGLGGAKQMIADGLFEKFPCDAVFGFHNMPGYPVGMFGFVTGPMMAAAANVNITIKGRGGHGAMPHLTVDPVVVAASIVMALQTIPARNVNPLDMSVVSVGSIHAGVANNVIPDSATMKLSVRSLDAKTQALLEERIKAIVHHQAESFGASCEIDYAHIFPVLINHDKETDFAREVAVALFGEERIIGDFPKLTGSEDFAFMLEGQPGSYLIIGNGTNGRHGYSVHHPNYDFNDEIIPVAASYWVALTERYLA